MLANILVEQVDRMDLALNDHIELADLLRNILTSPDEMEGTLDQYAKEVMTGVAAATVRRSALIVIGQLEETHEGLKQAIEDQYEVTPGSSNERCNTLVDKMDQTLPQPWALERSDTRAWLTQIDDPVWGAYRARASMDSPHCCLFPETSPSSLTT